MSRHMSLPHEQAHACTRNYCLLILGTNNIVIKSVEMKCSNFKQPAEQFSYRRWYLTSNAYLKHFSHRIFICFVTSEDYSRLKDSLNTIQRLGYIDFV